MRCGKQTAHHKRELHGACFDSGVPHETEHYRPTRREMAGGPVLRPRTRVTFLLSLWVHSHRKCHGTKPPPDLAGHSGTRRPAGSRAISHRGPSRRECQCASHGGAHWQWIFCPRTENIGQKKQKKYTYDRTYRTKHSICMVLAVQNPLNARVVVTTSTRPSDDRPASASSEWTTSQR